MTPENELFTTPQAAEYLKVSVSWLNNDRCKEKPKVPFVKIGAMVRYRKADIVEYIKGLSDKT